MSVDSPRFHRFGRILVLSAFQLSTRSAFFISCLWPMLFRRLILILKQPAEKQKQKTLRLSAISDVLLYI